MTGRHHVRLGWAGRAWVLLRVVAVATAVGVALGGSWAGYRFLTAPACRGADVRLTVAAAPELAPAVRAAADANGALHERCVAVTVSAVDPADVAAAVVERHNGTLDGVGRANGDVQVPDVWIPDSSLWLQRVRAGGPGRFSAEAPSVARSPVVLAMPEPAATELGWPGASLAWRTVLLRLAADSRVHSGVVEPDRDAAGLSALLAMRVGTAGETADRQTMVPVLRSLATGRSTVRDDLLARFPRSADPKTMASALTAAPLSEQAVIAYNARRPPVPLAAVYGQPAAMPLDYPFAVLPGLTSAQQQAAQAMLTSLGGIAQRDRLAELGLRAPDGTVGTGFPAPRGAPARQPSIAAAKPGAVDAALATWRTVTSPGRMLAVIDVSASMLEPVATAGGVTREQVTVESARRGLAMLDDSWAAGLWIFSTRLDNARDYRQLTPIGPLSSNRAALLRALATVTPKHDGGTGLYDTVLAAYRAVQDGWDPGRVNSVVIMTDGRNEDRRGGTLERLVANLRKTIDPARPVQVIALGIGNKVSRTELERIVQTTGGATFLAPDPSQTGTIFRQAIAVRAAGPR